MGILRTEELSKSYRGRLVVNRVSLSIGRGEVVGLLGPNGAGKTTSFRMVVGLIGPDSGRVLLDDRDITDTPMYERARLGISYLPQEPSVFRKLTVEENLLAILQTLRMPRRERREKLDFFISRMGLEKVRHSRADVLSGGERRRVEIARVLAMNPSFMLLDEPFTGVDPKSVSEIQEIVVQLRDRGLGVIITDHNVRDTLAITDRSEIIHEGRILLTGTVDEIMASEDARRLYLGERFRL